MTALAYNKERLFEFSRKNYCCYKIGKILLLKNLHAGIVSSLAVVDVIKALPSCLSLHMNVSLGDSFEITCNALNTPGYVVLCHVSSQQLKKDIATIEHLELKGLFETDF